MKIQKIIFWGEGVGLGVRVDVIVELKGGGGQGGCEQRIEVIV